MRPLTDGKAVTEKSETDSGDLTGGLVVPYRRQRAPLQTRIDDGYQVNTLDKFQGSERDLKLVSMTASDKGAIYRRTDFLLDPGRFNGALSDETEGCGERVVQDAGGKARVMFGMLNLPIHPVCEKGRLSSMSMEDNL